MLPLHSVGELLAVAVRAVKQVATPLTLPTTAVIPLVTVQVLPLIGAPVTTLTVVHQVGRRKGEATTKGSAQNQRLTPTVPLSRVPEMGRDTLYK